MTPLLSPPPTGQSSPLPVILVGEGPLFLPWRGLLARSRNLSPQGEISGNLLADALRASPEAAVVAALPPRAGLAAALELASAGRVGVLQAPLHGGLADETLPEGARKVQVAHGWVNLPGQTWTTQMLAKVRWRRVTLRVRGLPESPGEELDEMLLHALALAQRLLPGATVVGATQEGESRAEVTLSGKNPLEFTLLVQHGGPELDLRLEGDKLGATWNVQGRAAPG